jgi:5-methylcytosine-specific restriction protein A
MIEETIDYGEPLLVNLGKLGDIEWINQYFDLVGKVLRDLGLDDQDERISLSVTKEGKLPLIIGRRYILLPLRNKKIKCIVPTDFKLGDIDGEDTGWFFSPETERDAKWIEVSFPVGKELPVSLYQSILSVCRSILVKSKKSNFRKTHSPLLYYFIVDPEFRKTTLTLIADNGLLKKRKPVLSDILRVNKTFLLTWNPSRWEWSDYQEKVTAVQNNGSTILRWSCGNSKNIKVDDQVFLMRVGPLSPGIIGSGYVVKAPFKDTHFSDEDREALYVEVAFDTLVDYQNNLLSLEVLKQELPQQLWTPQASGISIKKECLSKLETLWFNYQSLNNEQKVDYSSQPESEEVFLEGKAYSVLQTKYERDPEARKKCLEKKGYACCVCGFDFQQAFGQIGTGFIHVHHVFMLSDRGGVTETDPDNDLKPVCPNCHAMLHKRYPPFSIQELKDIITKPNKQR